MTIVYRFVYFRSNIRQQNTRSASVQKMGQILQMQNQCSNAFSHFPPLGSFLIFGAKQSDDQRFLTTHTPSSWALGLRDFESG